MVNEFLDEIHRAKMLGVMDGESMPYIESPREIIEHYNKHNLASFDGVGYFIFQDVKVYEEGKREAAIKRDNMSMEEKTFGKGKA